MNLSYALPRNGLVAALILAAAGSAFPSLCRGFREELDYSRARPSVKKAIPVRLNRTPFPSAEEPERPLPIVRDKDEPTYLLQSRLAAKLKSVIRGVNPLILVGSQVFQPGDEIFLGRDPVVPKYRAVLKTVADDRLVVCLVSTDTTNPGQVDAVVSLKQALRHN